MRGVVIFSIMILPVLAILVCTSIIFGLSQISKQVEYSMFKAELSKDLHFYNSELESDLVLAHYLGDQDPINRNLDAQSEMEFLQTEQKLGENAYSAALCYADYFSILLSNTTSKPQLNDLYIYASWLNMSAKYLGLSFSPEEQKSFSQLRTAVWSVFDSSSIDALFIDQLPVLRTKQAEIELALASSATGSQYKLIENK